MRNLTQYSHGIICIFASASLAAADSSQTIAHPNSLQLAANDAAAAAPAGACIKRFADPVPRGDPGRWITGEDYPPVAQRAGLQGYVNFRVNISALGRVENVEILESQGGPILAEATSKILMRRGRFSPAMRNCQAVPGEYEGRLRWTLPE